ncbi:MAG: hypothetical protein PUE98_07610 [Galactobacillus timonensis]|uniref:hypothetical protein n=1 Tax=Galactobacillus timonensis TaxID=2041840 RepID=UPI00240A0AF2|nr:hypothetical protein [Galactobacillus timonensis]MDD6600314.1 hypothetical protein [Galactobacillus timonensis]MDD6679899.1 hypothetical protein [Galactobacillus timonensis]
MKTVVFHLPGLFEYYDLYRVFLPLFHDHREYFHDWCRIGSIYGAPAACIWGGGRTGAETCNPEEVLQLTGRYGISACLTFSNSLLKPEHLKDPLCNDLCRRFSNARPGSGVIVSSDLLTEYLHSRYPSLYLVSSTTKVLTEFSQFKEELNRPAFSFAVPDFRLNKDIADLQTLTQMQKDKTAFLVNECCDIHCGQRRECYEAVSRDVLGIDGPVHVCHAPHGAEGYRFSRAMHNPSFISVDDILNVYLPLGFSHFKIEGRSLGSALILEFLLYYLTRPEYQINVREEIYLSNTLDLF